jgi:HEPN domain-containing protein
MSEFVNREVKEWFEEAESDFYDAQYLLADDRGNSAAIFLQQAVEKALKALQISERQEYDYSHDLIELSSENVGKEFF